MHWEKIGHIALEAAMAGAIAFATAVIAVGHWPSNYEWLVTISGSAAAALKGGLAYLRSPVT